MTLGWCCHDCDTKDIRDPQHAPHSCRSATPKPSCNDRDSRHYADYPAKTCECGAMTITSWEPIFTSTPSTKTGLRELHTLWTKAVGTPDYVKDEWLALEAKIVLLQRRAGEYEYP